MDFTLLKKARKPFVQMKSYAKLACKTESPKFTPWNQGKFPLTILSSFPQIQAACVPPLSLLSLRWFSCSGACAPVYLGCLHCLASPEKMDSPSSFLVPTLLDMLLSALTWCAQVIWLAREREAENK